VREQIRARKFAKTEHLVEESFEMRSRYLLMVFGLTLAFAALQTAQAQLIPVTNCGQTLDAPGEYVLMNDLSCEQASGDFDGVRITASNVTFHLAGHTISSSVCDPSRNVTGIFVVGGITNVKIDGGNVSGFNDGIVLSASNSSVTGVKVTGACQSGIHVQGTNNLVENNTATDNGDGISLISTKRTIVHCNNLSDNLRTGVVVSGTGRAEGFFEANIIEDNILCNNGFAGGFGVAIFNGSYNIIRDNAVNHDLNGIFIDTPNNRVRNNTVNGSLDVGIAIGSSGSPSVVRYNTVLGSGKTDMSDDSGGCGANIWRDNTFMTDLVNGVPDGGMGSGCIK
jgi:parallel beta-helix repeat protein